MMYEEQTVGTKTIVVQVLQKNNKQMDEVVVVGYGSKKRVNVQGAVSTVKAADIEDLPVANLGVGTYKQGTWCISKFWFR